MISTNSLRNSKNSDFAFSGENSNSRMPYEKKAENRDVFIIANGVATGDKKNSPSLKAEGTFLDRLDRISFHYRTIYSQLRSFLEVYDIREIILSSSENFFITSSSRQSFGQEVLLMKILLLNNQLIWSFDIDKLPKNCDNLTFLDVKDSDALNYNIAINTRADILNCQPILEAFMRKHGIQKKVASLF